MSAIREHFYLLFTVLSACMCASCWCAVQSVSRDARRAQKNVKMNIHTRVGALKIAVLFPRGEMPNTVGIIA